MLPSSCRVGPGYAHRRDAAGQTAAAERLEGIGQYEHCLLTLFDVCETLANLLPLLQEWEPPAVAGVDQASEALELGYMLVSQGTGGVALKSVQDDEVRVIVEVVFQEPQATDALLVRCPLCQ